jgi:hypothetical protein
MQSLALTESMQCTRFKKACSRRLSRHGGMLYITRLKNHLFDVVSEILYRCFIDVRTCFTSASSSPAPKR